MTDVDYKRPLPPRRSASNSRTVCLFMVVVEFRYWFARMMSAATCPFHLYRATTVRRAQLVFHWHDGFSTSRCQRGHSVRLEWGGDAPCASRPRRARL